MNMAVGDGVIAAGQDGICCVMKIKHCKQKGGGQPSAKDGEAYCYLLVRNGYCMCVSPFT